MNNIKIDLSKATTSYELHKLLKEKFCFPEYYGMNWDAFWDCIIDQIAIPKKIIFSGWHKFENDFPRDAVQIVQCFEDLGKEYPEHHFLIEFN